MTISFTQAAHQVDDIFGCNYLVNVECNYLASNYLVDAECNYLVGDNGCVKMARIVISNYTVKECEISKKHLLMGDGDNGCVMKQLCVHVSPRRVA